MKRSRWLGLVAAAGLLLPTLATAQTVSTATTAVIGPTAVTTDNSGNKYVADGLDGRVVMIAQDGTTTTLATLSTLGGIAVSSAGTIYVSDIGNNRIQKIVGATVTTLAGGTSGSADGNGTAAQFNRPMGLMLTPNGMLFVADRDNNRIRRIDTATADVTTVAGSTAGYVDDVGTNAKFSAPRSVAQDPLQNLYVADTGNSVIRKISPTGVVTTLAGGTAGYADGVGTGARFLTPHGVAVDPSGYVHVADTGNNRVRTIAPDGTVTTMAGTGVAGYLDGAAASAQFQSPRGLYMGSHGTVFVADYGNNAVRKIGWTNPYPTITDVSPVSGPIAGGTPVTMTGSGFVTGATVAFGGAQGVGVTVVNDTTITVTTPARGAGVLMVSVRNPDGQLSTLFPGFGFYFAPSSITFGALAQAFDGTPKAVTVTTAPPGLTVGVTYQGGASTNYYAGPVPPTNAGTYSVLGIIDNGTYADYATALLTITLPPVVPVDLGGVGKSNIAIFRDSTAEWWISGQSASVVFGQSGDIPVVADYTGDGKADLAVYRPSTSEWIIQGQAAVVFGQSGDVPVPGDYNGDGKAEMAVFRPSTGEWIIQGRGGSMVWGMKGDIPVPADYNGDGVTDLAVFRPTTGTWYVMGGATLEWGMWGDVPVPADYNGDGKAEMAVYRPSTGWWYVAGGVMAQWGAPGDVPVPLDVDGDGVTEFVVYRPTTGFWYALDPVTSATTSLGWGEAGDAPVGLPPHLPVTSVLKTAGDFDHDGSADVTVFRPSDGTWYTLESTFGYRSWVGVTLGQDGDIPVPGDYLGTAYQERAVYRPSTGQWLLEDGRTFTLGAPGDIPVPRDYDGDGIRDIAVFTPGTAQWSVLTSSSGFTSLVTTTWGQPGDMPAPGDYDGDGKADYAVFTPATGVWSIWGTKAQAPLMTVAWGMSGDIPVQGDFDGDGKADIGVYRPSTGYWYGLFSSAGWSVTYFQSVAWGAPGDIPVPGDYNGDGRMDPAVYRPSTGTWYVYQVMTVVGWGNATDVPILGRQ